MMKLIAWFGTFTSIIGSFTVAMQLFVWGYILFLMGSVSWLFLGIRTKNMPLAVLNGTFLLANLLGLYNALT